MDKKKIGSVWKSGVVDGRLPPTSGAMIGDLWPALNKELRAHEGTDLEGVFMSLQDAVVEMQKSCQSKPADYALLEMDACLTSMETIAHKYAPNLLGQIDKTGDHVAAEIRAAQERGQMKEERINAAQGEILKSPAWREVESAMFIVNNILDPQEMAKKQAQKYSTPPPKAAPQKAMPEHDTHAAVAGHLTQLATVLDDAALKTYEKEKFIPDICREKAQAARELSTEWLTKDPKTAARIVTIGLDKIKASLTHRAEVGQDVKDAIAGTLEVVEQEIERKGFNLHGQMLGVDQRMEATGKSFSTFARAFDKAIEKDPGNAEFYRAQQAEALRLSHLCLHHSTDCEKTTIPLVSKGLQEMNDRLAKHPGAEGNKTISALRQVAMKVEGVLTSTDPAAAPPPAPSSPG